MQIFLNDQEPSFLIKGELSLSITIEKLPTDFFQQTYSIAQSTDSSTPDIDLISVSGYAICIKAIFESQLKHTPNIDQSLPYMRHAHKFACSLPDEPLVTLKSEKLKSYWKWSTKFFTCQYLFSHSAYDSPHELLWTPLSWTIWHH